MAASLSLSLRNWSFFIALICLSISWCNSSDVATGEAGKELPTGEAGKELPLCFEDHYIYSCCEDQFRLKAEGSIEKATEAAEEYCKGPCFVETEHVLLCIDETLHGEFRFENGASVEDVRHGLETVCGQADKKGDINGGNEHGDEEHHQDESGDEEHGHEEGGNFSDHPGVFGYYDHGNKLDISAVRLMAMTMMFVICGALLLSG